MPIPDLTMTYPSSSNRDGQVDGRVSDTAPAVHASPGERKGPGQARPRVGRRDEHIVRDTLDAILSLPATHLCFPMVQRVLDDFTSSALAALFKELSTHHRSHQAYELFNSIRSLGSMHPYAHLIDVYTYTTIISHCESVDAVPRAIQLVRDMEDTGIERNAHTYSAIMKVCIRGNHLGMALTTYNNMLKANLKPTLITYNTLIDVWGGLGNPAAVVNVLHVIKSSGLNPELRSYNVAIKACGRCSACKESLQVFFMLLADNKLPCMHTFSLLLTNFASSDKQAEYCDQVLNALQPFDPLVSLPVYAALIQACLKCGPESLALDAYERLKSFGAVPGAGTVTHALEACIPDGRWQDAEKICDDFPKFGLLRDEHAVMVLYRVYAAAGQWHAMLHHFKSPENSALSQDLAICSLLLEELWNSGVKSARASAIAVLRVLPPTHNPPILQCTSPFDWTFHASTPAVAMVALVTVLCHLVSSVKQLVEVNGATITIQIPNQRSAKHSPRVSVSQTVALALSKASAPAICKHFGGGLHISLPMQPLLQWLLKPSTQSLLLQEVHAACDLGSTHLSPSEQLRLGEVYACTFATLRKSEELLTSSTAQMADPACSLDWYMTLRTSAIAAITQKAVHDQGQEPESVELAFEAIFLVEYYLRTTESLEAEKLHEMCDIAMKIVRQADKATPVAGSDGSTDIYDDLKPGLQCCSPICILDFYLHVLDLQQMGRNCNKHILYQHALYAFPKLLHCRELSTAPPTILAAAHCIALRRKFGLVPYWPKQLKVLTKLTPDLGRRLANSTIASSKSIKAARVPSPPRHHSDPLLLQIKAEPGVFASRRANSIDVEDHDAAKVPAVSKPTTTVNVDPPPTPDTPNTRHKANLQLQHCVVVVTRLLGAADFDEDLSSHSRHRNFSGHLPQQFPVSSVSAPHLPVVQPARPTGGNRLSAELHRGRTNPMTRLQVDSLGQSMAALCSAPSGTRSMSHLFPPQNRLHQYNSYDHFEQLSSHSLLNLPQDSFTSQSLHTHSSGNTHSALDVTRSFPTSLEPIGSAQSPHDFQNSTYNSVNSWSPSTTVHDSQAWSTGPFGDGSNRSSGQMGRVESRNSMLQYGSTPLLPAAMLPGMQPPSLQPYQSSYLSLSQDKYDMLVNRSPSSAATDPFNEWSSAPHPYQRHGM